MTISAGGTTVLGESVKIDGANLIALADDATVQKTTEIVGMALETGSNDKVIQVLVGFL